MKIRIPIRIPIRILFAALLCWSAAAFGQGYRVIDVMPDYWKFDAQARGLDEPARLKLFHELVIDRHPEVYTAPVIGLAEDKPFDQELARRFVRVDRLIADKTELMRRLSDSIA